MRMFLLVALLVLASTTAHAQDIDILSPEASASAAPVLNAGGQSVRYKEAASSAAAIFSARCSSGASGQGMGGGGSIAIENPLCDVTMAYEVAWSRCVQGVIDSCDAAEDLFDRVVELGQAAAGAGGWRSWPRRYLPNIIAWLF